MLKDRVTALEVEKEEWRGVSSSQATKIRLLEEDLKKTRLQLSDEKMTSQELRKEKQELSISSGNVEIDRNRVVNEFIPEKFRRLLASHEYKQALAEPFNLYSQSGFMDGVHVGRELDEAMKMLENIDDIDLEAEEKYQPLYDQLFVKDYPYVQKDPAPSQVTQIAGSDGLNDLLSEPVNESTIENPSHQDSSAKDTSGPV